MQSLPTAVRHLGIALGTLCAIAGIAFQGPESGVLWGIVGYFLGKSLQSTLWTLAGEYTT